MSTFLSQLLSLQVYDVSPTQKNYAIAQVQIVMENFAKALLAAVPAYSSLVTFAADVMLTRCS